MSSIDTIELGKDKSCVFLYYLHDIFHDFLKIYLNFAFINNI